MSMVAPATCMSPSAIKKKRSLESSWQIVVVPTLPLMLVLQLSLRLPRSTNGPTMGA
jgi:hypothetical protein